MPTAVTVPHETANRCSGAYLFGSYAKGNATLDSDIDILILSPDFSDDRFENLVLLLKARRGIDRRIEPHLFKEEKFNEQHPFFQEVRLSRQHGDNFS